MPGHIATPPTQILGHLLRRTTQKANGVRKFDPEIVRRFTGPSLASERYTRKRLLKGGTKKWPLPPHLPRSEYNPRTIEPPTPGTHGYSNPAKILGKRLGHEKGRGRIRGARLCELFS